MPDYTEKDWSTGDKFTAAEATAMSAELEEQEVKDAAQDAVDATKQPIVKTGTCATAIGTAAKVVMLDAPWASHVPIAGEYFLITFANGTSVSNPTLAINGSAARNIRSANGSQSVAYIRTEAGGALFVRFDGTYYRMEGVPAAIDWEIATTEVVDPGHASSTAGAVNGRRLALLRSPVHIGDVITTPAGFTTIPRFMANGTYVGLTGANGHLRIGHFRAPIGGNRSTIHAPCASAPSGGTPTLIRFGVWRVETNGDYTLLATTANDTTLLAVAGTVYSKALSATINFVAGQEYAIGALIYQSAGTAPGLYVSFGSNSNELYLPPRISGAIYNITDLPSAVVNGGAGNIAAATPLGTGVGVTYVRFS